MTWLEEYRIFAMALELNIRSGHSDLATYCRLKMKFVARSSKLPLKKRKEIEEEVRKDIEQGYKKLKMKPKAAAE